MSTVKVDVDLDLLLEWGEDGEVTLDEKSFFDNAPEGLTADIFERVDEYRNEFVCGVAHTVMNDFGDREKAFLTEYGLGGTTSVFMDLSEGQLIVDIHSNRDVFDDVFSRVDELFASRNGDDEEVDEDD